jgi:hypothetical protein
MSAQFSVRAALVAAAILVLPAGASAATLQATPSNLSSVYSSAKAGDTIQLASGSYGSFTGASKSGMVTLKAASGATPTMSVKLTPAAYLTLDGIQISGLSLSGKTNNITVRNSTFTGQAYLNLSGNANANILIDHNTFKPWNAGASSAEGRLHITQPGALGSSAVGVKVSNNLFQGPGCSDGIQIGAYGVVVGPGNTFTGIKQGSCAPHVDSVQLYGQSHTTITGNYFVNFTTAIMAPDGGNTEIITNNVIDSNANSTNAVQFGSFKSSTFSHNTVRGTSVNMDHKSGSANSSGGKITNNIMVNGNFNASGSVCTSCTIDHNLFNSSGRASGTNTVIGTPVFTGGTNPTTYAGFALASGSVGKGKATDGTDLGVNVSGTTTPPTEPTPTDPTPTEPTPVPAKAVWTAPTNVKVGQTVTLDGTRSTGTGTLTCTWSFENQDGSTIWETIRGCKIYKAFQNADTKYVKLIVKDANGSTSSNRQSFAVTR